MSWGGQTHILSSENKPALTLSPAWTFCIEQDMSVSCLEQHLCTSTRNPSKVHVVPCSLQFFIWLGSVKWRSAAEIGLIWAIWFPEKTFVLQVLYETPKIAGFLCKPRNNPASICLTSQTVPSMQTYGWIFPTACLVMKRDLPQLSQGFRKPQRKPQWPQPKSESKFKGLPLPLNTAGLYSNRLDLRGHLAPRI